MNSKSTVIGLTLIELLITVAIVAILATIALPAYYEFIRESRRADAHSALSALQLAQENYRGNCPTYASIIGGSTSCAISTIKGSAISRDQYYDISIVTGTVTGNSYELEATPRGDQVSDTQCAAIRLTVNISSPNGLKSPADCW